MKRTLIQNAVVINEGRKVLGSVVIENEKIAEILRSHNIRVETDYRAEKVNRKIAESEQMKIPFASKRDT